MNYTATFLSLFRMMDMLHIEEDCWVYRENMRWNGKPIYPISALFPSITTSCPKTRSSKGCKSARSAVAG